MIVIFNIVLMFVACYLTCVFAIEKRPKREPIEQAEQPEQSTTDYERPNVFYSKDIQIVSEPNYLVPPFKFDDAIMSTVQSIVDDSVVFSFLFDGNAVSILIKDSAVRNEIINCELNESKNIIVEYLKNKNILK
jgi:hypothetical protein